MSPRRPEDELRGSQASMASTDVPMTPRKSGAGIMRAVGGLFRRKSGASSRSSMSSAPSERSWRMSRSRSRPEAATTLATMQPPHQSSKQPSETSSANSFSSPSDPTELDVADASPEFLFYGGSDVDGTFKPDLRPSHLDLVQPAAIRPVVKQHMPVFFSAPQYENLRRSSILGADPREYEF